MAVIQVPGRISGKTYSVQISGDTPTPTEQARIRAYLEEQEAAFSQQYQTMFGTPLAAPDDGTALGRGWDMGKSSAYSRLGSAVEYLGSGLGLESLAGLGQGMRQEGDYEAFLKSLQQPAPTTLEDVQKAEGVFPTISKALTYAGEQAGQTGPESLASLGAAVAGGLAAGPVGAIAAGAAAAAPTIFGGNVQRQEAEVAAGRKGSVDVGAALAATVGQAALESISDKLLLTGLVKPGMKIFTRTVAGAGEGAVTEGVTEVGQQVIERYQAGLPLDNDEAIKEYIEAGVAGGVIGGGVRGGTSALGLGAEKAPELPASRPAARPATPPATAVTPPAPVAPPAAVTAPSRDEASPPPVEAKAEQPAPAVRPASGVSIDEDLADARAVFDERLAIVQEGGASPEEAQQIAARAAVNYVDSLQEDRKARLARFRSAMERLASPTRGVMPPSLPDEAYAAEFGPPLQPTDLFAPARPETPDYTVETEEDAFDRAATQAATARTARPAATPTPPAPAALRPVTPPPAAATRPAVPSATPVVPAPAPAPQPDLFSAPPPPAAPVAPAPVAPAPALTAPPTPTPAPAAPPAAAPVSAPTPLPTAAFSLAPTQETANVPKIDAAESGEVGAGAPSGVPSVGDGGRPDDLVPPAQGAEAPAAAGLGERLPVLDRPAAPAGVQPPALTESGFPADPDKPFLPDTRGRGVRFHGSTSEITQVEDGYVGSDRNFYGQGFYTSDAVAITDGYSKAKGAKDGAVYRVDEIGPVNALDMEQPVPDWLISDYEAGRSPEAEDVYDLVLDAIEEMRAEGKALNLRELYDLIRDISVREAMPTYEVQEYFDSLSQIIMARGFNALDHIGGLRTKKVPHSVRIYLAPKNTVRITKVDPKNSDMTPSVEMPTADTAAGVQPPALTELEDRLAAARTRAIELRKNIPAGVLQRELVGGKIDPALPKTVSNLQNVLARQERAAETAKAAIPEKATHPARPKKLAAYEAALAKIAETRAQLAAAQDTLSTAELKANVSRAAEPKGLMTDKAQQSYTDYVNALREADTIRQTLETERARVAAGEPAPAPLPTDLQEPVIPDTFVTYRRGVPGKPIPPATAPRSVAEGVQAEAIMKRLVQYFMQRATPNLKKYTTASGGINNPTVWRSFPDWMPLADQNRVVQLLGRLNRAERDKYKFTVAEVEPLSREAEAAHTYFSKTVRPVDAIDMMLDDLSADYEIYEGSLRPGFTEIEHRDLMMGTGSKVARQALDWVRANLSPKTNAEIDVRLKKMAERDVVTADWIGTEGADRVAKGRELRAEARKARAQAATDSGYTAGTIVQKMAALDPYAALDQEMHYSVKNALNAGDLRGALQALARVTSNPELKALANRFSELVGTTRVRVLYPGDSAKYIKNYQGVFVQQGEGGANADKTYENVILLNGQIGMTNHTLMHEMSHAVTSNLLHANPNHPVIRQLRVLLDELRKAGPSKRWQQAGRTRLFAYPDAFYGLTNINEMVAEAYGRLTFGDSDNGLRDLMKRTRLEYTTTTETEIPLTAWERFKEIVGNFLRSLIGRPPKRYPRKTRTRQITSYETGLDRFHRLVDGLLSEAPQVLPDAAFDSAVIHPLVGKQLLDNAVLNADVWSPEGRSRLSSLMSSAAPQPLRRALLGLLQLDWFNDLAGGYFPQIGRLKQIDDQRRGKINSMNTNVKPVLEDLLAYAKKSPELYATLMGIQGQATLEGVDPTELVTKYDGNKEKTDKWYDLDRQLAADTTGEMRALFRKTRNIMRAYRSEIERVLKSRVKDITDDATKQKQLFAQLMAKLDEENAIDPYFSLMRKGDYWLEYTAEDTTAEPVSVDPMGRPTRPTARFVQAFESPFALAQFRAKLEAATDDRGNPVAWDFEENRRPISDMNKEGYVPPAFVQGALNVISGFDRPDATAEERAKIDDARDAIHSMFLRLTPDHSLLKSFLKRKGTRGFIGDITPLGVIDAPIDMLQALADKTTSLSYQLANIEYGGKIQALINIAGETRNTLSKSPSLTLAQKAAIDAYHAEFVDRAKFAKSPQVGGMAQLARGVTFNMTLGFSIAGAANNLMQIPMVGMTELGGRYGMSMSMKEMGFAMRAVMNAGKTQKVLSFGADGREVRTLDNVDNYGSIANYFEPNEDGTLQLRTDIHIPAKLRDKIANLDVLAEVLANNGMLSSSMSQEMLEAETGWLHKINRWGGFLMHHAERFNRQSMAIATYNLELGKVKGEITREAKLAAAKKAVEITERVNGSIGAATAPRFAHGAVGSVLFMFKRFGLHMARYIIGTANQAIRGATPEDRAVARYQIVGMLGTTALFAGVQGLPFFSELMTLFNVLFTDDDEERPEVIVQKFLGEPYYNGALNYLLGVEVASRISMSGLIFRENKIEKDQSVYYDLIEMFGGPAVGVALNFERGFNLISEGEFYRGVEAMLPSTVKSLLKAYRFSTEGATTLRGDEIVPLTSVDILKQALGYTPVEYARQQERVSGAKRIDEAIRNKKRRLLRRYNLALSEGDFTEAREVLRDVRVFNRQHPEDAITQDTLNRSNRSFRQTSERMISGVSFTGSGRERAQQYISEFDDDLTAWGS